ncbi:MAG TPA: tRNA (adenosine(37)-N6)-threonylcarbamoyltransferase complex dimerization subunit type 1 TsaB [Cyclobacteriaceae bacterium]|jgi:tRNA threonylcarbamoyladenosine biosynthesis protein TsaB|nr:tRNA (adenosine(37)-N6)-threonylcarbamoyltransferase complex dimerization subunit type 1 TsaB [Cyclobacteriaceae bacterium]
MAILLSIETATHACSAALHEDGKLLATSELHTEQKAGSQLAVLIDRLLEMCQLTPNQINAIAISSGPGSYTGLRIGVATAKGLCFSLNIPLISINTLELMAYHVRSLIINISEIAGNGKILLCPMLDARRMEVYTLLTDFELNVIRRTEAMVLDEHSFEQELNAGIIIFFGNGANKFREVVKHPNAHFMNEIIPLASIMGKLAFDKWNSNQTEDLITFEPFYLKDFMIKKPKPV